MSTMKELRAGVEPVPGYFLERYLGEGAMGVVWVARTDDAFEPKRAIKFIDVTDRGGSKEYRALKTVRERGLAHPNLLKLYNYWLKDREGRVIPRAEEPDNTHTASYSAKPSEACSSDMTATTPQSAGTTNATSTSGTRAELPAAGPSQAAASHNAVTLVSSGTVADAGSHSSAAPPPAVGQRQAVELILAMELGDKTLADRLKECVDDRMSGIPVDELLPYMDHAARGLDYLDHEEIIHRDVKPANIMIVKGLTKLCDYGLVVATTMDLSKTSVACSPVYASPEAVSNKPVRGKSDQYSLAVTYIELRTGRTPYANETASAVYSAKETGVYDLSRIRNRAVKSVLSRAMAKNPAERYPTCVEFVRELARAETPQSAPSRVRIGPLVTVAIVLLGLVVGGFGLFSLLRTPDDVRQLTADIDAKGALLDRTKNWAEASKVLNTERPTLDALETELNLLVQRHRRVDDKLLRARLSLLRGRLAIGNDEWSNAGVDGDPPAKMPPEEQAQWHYVRILNFANKSKDRWDQVEAELARLATNGMPPEVVKQHVSEWERTKYPPSPASGFEKALAKAREVRLYGDPDEANGLLNGVKAFFVDGRPETARESIRYRLERLHLDLARNAIPANARAEAERLATQVRSDALDRDELAAVRLRLEAQDESRPLAEMLELFLDVNWKQLDEQRLSRQDIDALVALRQQLIDELGRAKSLPTVAALTKIWPYKEDRLKILDALEARLTSHKDGDGSVFEQAQREYNDLFKALELDKVATPEQFPVRLFASLKLTSGNAAAAAELNKLRAYLEQDQELVDPLKCKAILDTLLHHSDAVANDEPLTLLRAELELECNQALTPRIRNDLNRLADNPSGEQAEFARYLRARMASTPRPDELWPESSSSKLNWRTDRRKKLAWETLVRLAGQLLPLKTVKDLAGFSELTSQQVRAARECVSKAKLLQPGLAEIRGLDAVLLAIEKRSAATADDWLSILSLAEGAGKKTAPGNDPKEQFDQQVVGYVAALAAANCGEKAPADSRREAIKTLAELLRNKQVFQEDARADVTGDANLIENIVAPALRVGRPDSLDGDGKRNLALVWAARGRILERNDSLIAAEPAKKNDPTDSYSRAIMRANEAFGEARQLSDSIDYASGYARTLLELPHELFRSTNRQKELSELIDLYDREGTSKDAGLLLVGGWVKFNQVDDQGSWEEKSRLVNEAQRRFDALEKVTAERDPYNIRTLGLVNAGNVHVWAAFLTTSAADQGMTRLEHLQRAVSLADLAIRDDFRRLPEDAHIVRGNALEDLAWYCKLGENYPLAIAAFQDAAKASGPLRSSVHASMCEGRCQLRGALDAWAIHTDARLRYEKMAAANTALRTAVEGATSEKSMHLAQSKFWLAHVLQESALNGPGDLGAAPPTNLAPVPLPVLKTQAGSQTQVSARLRVWDNARQIFGEAASEALTGNLSDWAQFQLDSVDCGWNFAQELPATDMQRGVIVDAVKRQAADLLGRGGPTLTAPQAGKALQALAAAVNDRDGQQSALKEVNNWRKTLFAKPDDAWRWELLLALLPYSRNEDALSDGEKLARQFIDPTRQKLADGHCLKARADMALVSLKATPTDAELAAIQKKYVEAERHLTAAADNKVAANLKALTSSRDPKLDDILSTRYERQLGATDASRLREMLKSIVGVHASLRQVLDKRMAIVVTEIRQSRTAPFSPAAEEVARPYYQILKANYFLNRMTAQQVKPNDIEVFRIIENKLRPN